MRISSTQGFGSSRYAALWFSLIAWSSAVHAFDWLPIDPNELNMTSEPKAPGAAAVYLYRQVDRDDTNSSENIYNRIKILTDEGREYGNVQIEYEKGAEAIGGIEARTIEPDGRIVNFTGSVYDKPVVEARERKIMQKTLTLPELRAGCIIEYRYRRSLRSGYIFDSHWLLSDNLYTEFARFALSPYTGFGLRYSWPIGLPPGTAPPAMKSGRIRLETRDVPAFVTEEKMPPPNELKMRVDFIYQEYGSTELDPDKFWRSWGKTKFHEVEKFVDEKHAMEAALAEIVAPTDSPEEKLHKIYERVLKIRNTSFEREKTAQEADRVDEKHAHQVADVWTHGYGDSVQLPWLFLALARAAGLDADAVLVSTRDKYFFRKALMSTSQLNSNVVVVKLGGKDLYFDPGMPSTPFGMLPWNETGVMGLRLDKNGGTWVATPMPVGPDSQTLRTADLKLTNSGTLEGQLTVTYTGIEALWRRVQERNEDAMERKEFLEDQIKESVPSGIDVTLANQPDWDSATPSMTAIFDLKVPGWASHAGQRALLAAGLFGAGEQHAFQHGTRQYPIYFNFAHESIDVINIELPTGWQAATVPQPRHQTSAIVNSRLEIENQGRALRITRDVNVGFVILDQKFYGAVQSFFDAVRAGDEEQIVITAPKSTASN